MRDYIVQNVSERLLIRLSKINNTVFGVTPHLRQRYLLPFPLSPYMDSLVNKSSQGLKESKIPSNYVPKFVKIADLKATAILGELALLRNRIEFIEEYLQKHDMEPEEQHMTEDDYVNTS